ncbi:MAG: LysR family transcriptional regulator [Sphingomonadales bacterium]
MPELDLNLLRVFDTLIELRSVTRAAGRLGLTQSAVSHALGRLRQTIGDPLFVRGSGGLQPTARASEIAPGIREGLLQLRGALSPLLFDPAAAHRRFTISAGPYVCALLVPDLLARTRAVAPGVSFAIVGPGPELVAALDEGTIDLALGAFGRAPTRLMCEILFHEDLVWIARAGTHFAHDPPTPADIARNPQLTVESGRPYSGLGSYVSEGGLERRVTASSSLGTDGGGEEARAVVYDSITAAAVVSRTDYVALVPRRLAQRAVAPKKLVVIEPQGEREAIEMGMLWHNKLDADAGLAWLRGLIRESVGIWR